MKAIKTLIVFVIVCAVLPGALMARDVAPIVSADWLEKNLTAPGLVVVDIRKVEEFKDGHVPKSINIFYGIWAMKKNGLDNELPETDDLFDAVGSAGITAGSRVVVVGKTDTVADLVNMTRAAWTLVYGGVENVAILDGGFNKWKEGKKTVSMEAITPKAVQYKGKVNREVLAAKDHVITGEAAVVDTRMPDFFFGVAKLDFVERAGHVKGAASLPSTWIFTKEGTFKNRGDLEAIAAGVLGSERGKRIITYCDTGRLASGWWFALREILGYRDVRLYDGSMQEFAKDMNAPVVKFSWQ